MSSVSEYDDWNKKYPTGIEVLQHWDEILQNNNEPKNVFFDENDKLILTQQNKDYVDSFNNQVKLRKDKILKGVVPAGAFDFDVYDKPGIFEKKFKESNIMGDLPPFDQTTSMKRVLVALAHQEQLSMKIINDLELYTNGLNWFDVKYKHSEYQALPRDVGFMGFDATGEVFFENFAQIITKDSEIKDYITTLTRVYNYVPKRVRIAIDKVIDLFVQSNRFLYIANKKAFLQKATEPLLYDLYESEGLKYFLNFNESLEQEKVIIELYLFFVQMYFVNSKQYTFKYDFIAPPFRLYDATLNVFNAQPNTMPRVYRTYFSVFNFVDVFDFEDNDVWNTWKENYFYNIPFYRAATDLENNDKIQTVTTYIQNDLELAMKSNDPEIAFRVFKEWQPLKGGSEQKNLDLSTFTIIDSKIESYQIESIYNSEKSREAHLSAQYAYYKYDLNSEPRTEENIGLRSEDGLMYQLVTVMLSGVQMSVNTAVSTGAVAASQALVSKFVPMATYPLVAQTSIAAITNIGGIGLGLWATSLLATKATNTKEVQDFLHWLTGRQDSTIIRPITMQTYIDQTDIQARKFVDQVGIAFTSAGALATAYKLSKLNFFSLEGAVAYAGQLFVQELTARVNTGILTSSTNANTVAANVNMLPPGDTTDTVKALVTQKITEETFMSKYTEAIKTAAENTEGYNEYARNYFWLACIAYTAAYGFQNNWFNDVLKWFKQDYSIEAQGPGFGPQFVSLGDAEEARNNDSPNPNNYAPPDETSNAFAYQFGTGNPSQAYYKTVYEDIGIGLGLKNIFEQAPDIILTGIGAVIKGLWWLANRIPIVKQFINLVVAGLVFAGVMVASSIFDSDSTNQRNTKRRKI